MFPSFITRIATYILIMNSAKKTTKERLKLVNGMRLYERPWGYFFEYRIESRPIHRDFKIYVLSTGLLEIHDVIFMNSGTYSIVRPRYFLKRIPEDKFEDFVFVLDLFT